MLLDEAKAYTRAGLLSVFGCIILMFAGIQILAWKTNYLSKDENNEESNKIEDNYPEPTECTDGI